MNPWSVADIPSQSGQLAVVTGATGGLGYETALALARAGAEVLVTGRNAEKGRVAIEQIKRAVPSAKVRFAMLDLASLASVRAFAASMLADARPLDLIDQQRRRHGSAHQAPDRRRLRAAVRNQSSQPLCSHRLAAAVAAQSPGARES